MKKLIRPGIVIAIIAVALIYSGIFPNKTEVTASISAVELANTYAGDETLGDSLYLGKRIEISGKILKSDPGNETQTLVLEGSRGTNVRVEFPSLPASAGPGESVSVVGTCAGYLLDVIIVEAELKQ